jgi:hypothetical protein
MKQSDWLRSLSERAGFLHSARSETQLPAVKCNCPLWFSRQKPRSETIFKRKNLPKTFEKHSLTIVRIRKWIASSPKRLHTKHDVHQNWQYFDRNATETRKVIWHVQNLRRENYIFFKCLCIRPLKSEKITAETDIVK